MRCYINDICFRNEYEGYSQISYKFRVWGLMLVLLRKFIGI